VCHPASVDAHLAHAAELLAAAPGVELAALFGPEHGFHGTAQDLIGVGHARAGALPVHSLYGSTFASLKPTPEQLRGLDTLVIDLQDVGARYYTFQATLLYCMEACAECGVAVVVLDRPNPLGGWKSKARASGRGSRASSARTTSPPGTGSRWANSPASINRRASRTCASM
jgi:uncharacterized protein YbbC (DUF1343 family)